jgi:5-methylcytosine-specific restriction endonuclease McrA
VPDVPPQIGEIAERLRRNERVNRRPLQTFLGWFNAARRGTAVIAHIKETLRSAGIETDPDFATCNADDSIAFHLSEESKKASPPAAGATTGKVLDIEPLAVETPDAGSAQLASGFEEPSDDFLEPEADDGPPLEDDDRPVVSRPSDWTITALREKWEGGLLDLQPSFQREYVWQLKPELPSRLIESILLEIPIPPLYFGRLSGGKLEVIDGQQRLTTLIEFITNKFSLQRLTRMPSLNGQKFRDLSIEYQEKIKDTPIRTVEINAGNNMDLRFEIFERLNRGSMALNEQELRNCVFRGPFNVLLAELEQDRRWRSIKGGDTPEPRFKEREMILRFLALANRVQFYKGGLKRFLNDYMAKYAPREATAIEEQAQIFRQTMQNVYTVFGPNSGRLYGIPPGNRDGRWDKKFSIAALEIQASALLGQDPTKVQKVADQIQEHFLLLLLTDKAVQEAISQATGGSVPTKLRWSAFRSVIQALLDNVIVEPRFFSFEFRKKLFDANPICAICKNRIHLLEDSTVDHIHPYSKGGKTVQENGQLSHRSCNAIKNATIFPDASEREAGSKPGRQNRIAERRLGWQITGREVSFRFSDDPWESWELPANKEDKQEVRRIRQEALDFGRANGATPGQLSAIEKVFSDAGYYLTRPRS